MDACGGDGRATSNGQAGAVHHDTAHGHAVKVQRTVELDLHAVGVGRGGDVAVTGNRHGVANAAGRGGSVVTGQADAASGQSSHVRGDACNVSAHRSHIDSRLGARADVCLGCTAQVHHIVGHVATHITGRNRQGRGSGAGRGTHRVHRIDRRVIDSRQVHAGHIGAGCNAASSSTACHHGCGNRLIHGALAGAADVAHADRAVCGLCSIATQDACGAGDAGLRVVNAHVAGMQLAAVDGICTGG